MYCMLIQNLAIGRYKDPDPNPVEKNRDPQDLSPWVTSKLPPGPLNPESRAHEYLTL